MRRFGVVAVLALGGALMAFGPAERTAPAKWALVVGISDYINFEDEPGGDLPGAVRDARNMRDVLVARWGFAPDHVRMLLDREATRDAIEEGLTRWLPSVARPGDLVVFFFAGHGSQMWDESGDEDDGLDETLAPADVLAESTEFDISDDEMGEWLDALPTGRWIVIWDKCYSGTSTRAATPFSRARVLARDLSRIPKPEAVARRALPGQEDETGFDTHAEGGIELAAAQPFQVAVGALFEPPGGGEPYYAGAFTTHLVRQLWLARPGTSYEAVFEAARDALKRDRFEQDPMISGAWADDPAFEVEAGSGGAGIPVLHVSGEAVELGGGDLFGLTPGSVVVLEGGARAVIRGVRPDRAVARIVSGTAWAGEGGVARLAAYRFPESPLKVNVAGVDTETLDALSRELAGSAGIVLEDDPEAFSHLLLRRSADSLRILGLDGYTRHRFPAGPGAAAAVAAALRKEAAAKRLAEMENLAEPFRVEVWLADGRTRFGIGEAVTFHARSERAGYLTLVDLGTDGTVTVLFPNPDAPDNRVEAGETIVFPEPGAPFDVRALEPTGTGIVRAFLTERPLDLPAPGEGLTAGDAAFARRVTAAVLQAAGRPPESPEAVRLDTWGTAALVYEIVK